ncbi:MAG: hypothetical protein WBY47_11710 [Desulfobacterales bacterium]|jgi:hypothetical protein
MKRMIIIIILGFFFLLATAIPVISKDYYRDTQGRRTYKEHINNSDRHGDKKRPDYYKYRGYSERPYSKDRFYINYDYKGHRYDYNGHWRSWKQWDKYARKHPYIYKHGGYYRQSSHLMFRFCDPGTKNCFFFSIGR